jgi:septal ring factor EnvC (AmiA/AmiB activator)
MPSIFFIRRIFLTAALMSCLCVCQLAQSVEPPSPQPTKAMDLNRYEQLEKQTSSRLEKANIAIKKRQWINANIALKSALLKLGDHYFIAGIIDETGMKLALADTEERKHAIDTAAHIRQKILALRLAILQQKIEGLRTVIS